MQQIKVEDVDWSVIGELQDVISTIKRDDLRRIRQIIDKIHLINYVPSHYYKQNENLDIFVSYYIGDTIKPFEIKEALIRSSNDLKNEYFANYSKKHQVNLKDTNWLFVTLNSYFKGNSELIIMFIDSLETKVKESKEFQKRTPVKVRQDNKTVINYGSGFNGRTTIRYPKKCRKTAWKRFYRLFPNLKPKENVD